MIRQKRKEFSFFLLIAIAIWLMVYSLFMTAHTMETIRSSLGVFVRSVLPPLAVFSVCTKLFVKTNVISRWIPRCFYSCLDVLGMSLGGFSAFFVGLFAGFPTGAAMLSELCEKGEVSENEAASLLPYCNQASIAFLLGTVGESMFRDADIGFIFFYAQTVTAWICIYLTAHERRGKKMLAKPRVASDISVVSAFTSSIRESAFSMIGVCGFIVFFSLVGTVLFDTLSVLKIPLNEMFCAMIGGCLEISSGFLWLSGGNFSKETLLICGGVLLGFGGISVFMQAIEKTEAYFFSPRKYFEGKFLSSAICPIFSILFYHLSKRKNGKNLIFAVSILIFFIFYLLNYVKIKFFSKKCGKIERNAV